MEQAFQTGYREGDKVFYISNPWIGRERRNLFILMLTHGMPTGVFKMKILSTSFLEIWISSFYQIICFLCGMATMRCRLGCLTSNVCIMKILNDTIQWTLLCSIPHIALWSSSPPWQTWISQFPPFDDGLNSQCTLGENGCSLSN
jgi:hypothetical protein